MKLYRGELLQCHLIDISMADVAPCDPYNDSHLYTPESSETDTPILDSQQFYSPRLHKKIDFLPPTQIFSNRDQESVEDDNERLSKRNKNNEQCMTQKLPFESMALNNPSRSPHSESSMSDVIDALTIMSDGCLFLTICNKPHFQLMFLSEDNKRLQSYNQLGGELDKLHSLPLENILDVKYLDVVFLIKHKDGLIKLGATNSEDLYYWFVGLKTLLQPSFRGNQVLVVPPAEKKSFIPRLTELYGKMSCLEKPKTNVAPNVKKQRRQRQNPIRKAAPKSLVSTIPFEVPKTSRPESTPPVHDLSVARPPVPRRPASSFPKPHNDSIPIITPSSRISVRQTQVPPPKVPPPNPRSVTSIPRTKTKWVRKYERN